MNEFARHNEEMSHCSQQDPGLHVRSFKNENSGSFSFSFSFPKFTSLFVVIVIILLCLRFRDFNVWSFNFIYVLRCQFSKAFSSWNIKIYVDEAFLKFGMGCSNIFSQAQNENVLSFMTSTFHRKWINAFSRTSAHNCTTSRFETFFWYS